MKLTDLKEMAIRGGNLDKVATDFVHNSKEKWKASTHVGDIEFFKVKKFKDVYTVWDSEELLVTASAKEKDNVNVIDSIWVNPAHRGKKLLVKLLLFLRSQEHMTKMQLGLMHSDDTYDLLKAGGLKLFKKTWVNSKGEVKLFSPETIADFYGSGGWQLIMENYTEFTDEFPRFGYDNFVRSYEAMFNIFSLHEELDRI